MAERSYRPDIDGLRALAILSVVFYHACPAWLPGGFSGVDIFFVISGYLIGGHIYAELRTGAFSYLRFYQRRAKRILPAFYAVLVITIAASLFLLSPLEAAQTARSGFAAALSASNILFWITADYFAPKTELNPLLMTWSLGVEEQFYAIIPLLLVLLARLRRALFLPAILAACAVSFLFAWSELGRSPMLAFYMLPARAWELGAGVALAVVELNRAQRTFSGPPGPSMLGPARLESAPLAQLMSSLGLVFLLTPVFLLTTATPFPGPAALPSALGTTLVIAVPASWINRRLLSLPPLTFIGRISYSWYLWHWPLLAFLHIVCGDQAPETAAPLVIAASFAAAVLSYFFIEQPFRRSRRPSSPLLVRYALVGSVVLAVCAAVWLSKGLPQRSPALASIESAAQSLKSDPCLLAESDEPNLSAGCFDLSPTRQSVAIWGDSHAAALAPGLRFAANAHGYGFIELAKKSCPPLTGATHYLPQAPLRAEACIRFNSRSLNLLQADRRVRVVILAASWAAPFNRTWLDGWLALDLADQSFAPSLEVSCQLFARSLTASILALQAAGKQVIVLQDVPNFEVDPLWKVKSQRISVRRALTAWLRSPDAADPGFAAPNPDPNVALSTALLQQTAGLTSVPLVDLKSALCSAPTQCAYRSGENMLYTDSSHLSPDGALYALRNFQLPAADAPIQTDLRSNR